MESADIISIFAVLLAIVSVAVSVVTFRKTVIHDRKRDTLDAYNRLQNEAFDKLNLYRPSQIAEIAKNNKTEEYKTLSGYVARIEHFCVGVNMDIYDKETVYNLAHGYLDGDQIKNRILPFIEKKNKGSDTDYYENIKKVFEGMDKETQKRKESKSQM